MTLSLGSVPEGLISTFPLSPRSTVWAGDVGFDVRAVEQIFVRERDVDEGLRHQFKLVMPRRKVFS